MRRAAALALAVAVAGCGGGDDEPTERGGDRTTTTRVELVQDPGGRDRTRFDPAAIYRRDAPSVVTVLSVFGDRAARSGQGSGFVVSEDGEVATNAHVVTTGEGEDIERADEVYVKFADGNQVEARIVGDDPNTDVALLRIDPSGLTLRPLELGSTDGLRVGAPVAAIGSPFGEPQSLSVGVVSATGRAIESLTGFEIPGAVQTDAAINQGNSGGPLLGARGEVLGINSQIRTASGGGEGVGFAVPVDAVRRSLDQLRRDGRARYAYLGVASAEVYPQLAERFDLSAERGAWVQEVTEDGPADDAGVRGGGGAEERFQAGTYRTGGDVVVGIARTPVRDADDLGAALAALRPGQVVDLRVRRGAEGRTLRVRLGERPSDAGE